MLSKLSSSEIRQANDDAPGLFNLVLRAALICVVIYVAYLLWRVFKRTRWRESCPWIGKLFQALLGETAGFKLHMLVHKVKDVHPRAMLVAIKAASETVQTGESDTNMWQEEVTIVVPQGTKKLAMSLMSVRNARAYDVISKAQVDITDLFKDNMSGENVELIAERWIQLTSGGKSIGSLQVSFSKNHFLADKKKMLEDRGLDTDRISGPLGKLLADSTNTLQRSDSFQFGQPPTSADEALRQKLQLLAGAITGPVQITKHFGREKDKHLRAFLDRSATTGTKWCMAVSDNARSSATKVIPMLQITAVYPDTAKPHYFIIRYADLDGQRKEMILKRVDRERETWIEGLKLFIRELRTGIEQHRQRKKAPPKDGSFSDGMTEPSSLDTTSFASLGESFLRQVESEVQGFHDGEPSSSADRHGQ